MKQTTQSNYFVPHFFCSLTSPSLWLKFYSGIAERRHLEIEFLQEMRQAF